MTTELSTSLAENINEAFAEAMMQADNVKAHAKTAVEEAVRCGELLTEAKTFARSSWREWMAVNCPSISIDVAGKFMSGAKKIRERGIETFGGAQLLLFFAGGEAKKERTSNDRDPLGTNWLTEIEKITERFNRTLDHRPVADWSEAERLTFKHRIKPLVEIYGQL